MSTRASTRRSPRPAPAFACAILLAACRTPIASVEPGPAGVQVELPTSSIGGAPELERNLATMPRSSEVRGDRRLFLLDLVHTGERSLEFEYAFEWLDRQGRLLEGLESPWRRLRLGPGERAPVEVSVADPRAESWRLRARPAQR